MVERVDGARSDGRSASSALFTYGSLEFEEIMQLVTGRAFHGTPARLDGFARRTLPGSIYPGITASANETVHGTLYREIDAETRAVLDAFEGDAYRAIEVEVIVEPGASGEHAGPGDAMRTTALTYLAVDLGPQLAGAPHWDPLDFHARFFGEVVRSCRTFRREWLASLGPRST